MRISNSEASQQAIALVVSFMQSQLPRLGWTWKVVDASPDLQAPHARDRKTIVTWAVIVEWSFNGNASDGPAILHANIATKEVSI